MSSNHSSLRSSFVSRSLDDLLAEILNDIKETLYQDANFVKEPGLFTFLDLGLPTTLYPGTNKAKELDEFVYNSIFHRRSRSTSHSLYHIESGRIFLKRENWCLKNLIHEVLHSVSLFSIDTNVMLGTRYLFLSEGLTEFLTGFILWKNYCECFNAWKSKSYTQWCAIGSYEIMTKIWYTFTRFIDFKEVKKLFFGNGSSDWRSIWDEFILSINDAGYNFRDPIPGRIGRLQDRFVDQCRRAFGRNEFNRIFEMESSNFDYELIIS